MAVRYKLLFKLLIDKNRKKKDLAKKAGISLATITKTGREDTTVTTDALARICGALDCEINDIVRGVPDAELGGAIDD